nr:VOC family protein [Sphingomonas sp. TREG-RG-20F-R18-01]
MNLTALLVDEYDTALSFFVQKLGFELREDTALTDDKRWVVVAPHGTENGLLLARLVGDRQREAIGDQSGGRVFLILKQTILPVTTSLTRSRASVLSKRLAMNHMARWRSSKTSTETDGI